MAERRRVALVRCADYDWERVEEAVRRSLDALGGMSAFVRPGQRVLLKPNLLRSLPPERAATTHPAVVAAVARLVVEAGGRPIIVESPGGPYSTPLLRPLYRRTGMAQAAERGGAELNEDTATAQVAFPEGVILHRLDVVQPLLDADVVINLPKLKTHNLTVLTLAVKNLFGLVPGALKIGYHAKLQDNARFAQGLLDIYAFARPALNVLDAVVGMEGNGPSGGTPRAIGAILAGADALAVDITAAALVGVDPLRVLTTRMAVERGLTTGRLEDVEILGETIDALRVKGFKLGTAAPMDPGLFPKGLQRLVLEQPSDDGDGRPRRKGLFSMVANGWMARQLVVVPQAGAACTGCGFCARHCPVGAIEVIDGRAHMDHSKCIRCYCCHELCPETAVELTRPWLGQLVLGR